MNNVGFGSHFVNLVTRQKGENGKVNERVRRVNTDNLSLTQRYGHPELNNKPIGTDVFEFGKPLLYVSKPMNQVGKILGMNVEEKDRKPINLLA